MFVRNLLRKIYITHKKHILHRTKHVTFHQGSDIIGNTVFEDSVEVYGRVEDTYCEGGNTLHGEIKESYIGYGSFIAPNSNIKFTKIGRYTSIGQYVHIIRGQHPTQGFVSTAPCFYSLAKQNGFTYVNEQLFDDYRYLAKAQMEVKTY